MSHWLLQGGGSNIGNHTHLREDGLRSRWVRAVDRTVKATLSARPPLDLSNSHHIPTDKAPMLTTNSV